MSPIVWTKKTTLSPTLIFMQSDKRVYWIAADVIVRWVQAAAPALAVKSNANGYASDVEVSVQALVPSDFFTKRSVALTSPSASRSIVLT